MHESDPQARPSNDPDGAAASAGREVAASDAPARSAHGQLSPLEREMLRFEGELWRYTGAKERAIRERFDMSPTEYYLALMRLIDREEAWAADPIVTKKLAAARSRRSATRAARRIREAGS